MDEPQRRLVDDPAVSSSLRDDLARAGQEHRAYAAAYDAATKAAGLQAALASQGGGVAGAGLLTKVALGVTAATVFMLAGAALHARLQGHGAPAQRAGVTVPAAPPARVAPQAAPQVMQVPTIMAPEAPSAAPSRAPGSLPRLAKQNDTQQEIHQLARIRAYLQSGDPVSALELAERGQRELGESALWQEREALAVLALLQLARTEQAELRSAVLLSRFPSSPFRAEIERRLRRAHDD
jgi:hypothetical protein